MLEIISSQQRADKIYTILSRVLSDPQKPKLETLHGAVQAQAKIAGELKSIFDDDLSEARTPLDTSLEHLIDLKRGRSEVWEKISPHPLRDHLIKGRLSGVIIPRIRVKLGQKELPWPLRWMQRYALDEHPMITAEKNHARKEVTRTREDFEYRREQITREQYQRLEVIRRQTDADLRRLLVFAHNQAATSVDVAVSFIQGFPNELDNVGWAYASLNELILVGSEQYEDFTVSQRLSTHQLRMPYRALPLTFRQAWRRTLKDSYETTVLESIAARSERE